MNNKELPRGRQTFGLRTGLPLVREKELAPAPTKEETAKANAGKFAGETRVVKKVGGNRLLKTVLAGSAVVAGGAIAYEAVPAVHRTVGSAFLDNFKGKLFASSETSTKVNLKEVFDNEAQKQIIWEGNTQLLPQEEIDRLYPDAFRNGILHLQYPIDLSKTANPQAKISATHTFYAVKFADGRVGYYHQFFFKTVDPGDTLDGAVIRSLVPNGNVILTGKSNSPNIEIGSFTDGFFTDIQDPNGNIHRLMLSGGLQVPSSSGLAYKNMPYIFESQINAPRLSQQNNGIESKRISKRGEEVVIINPPETGNIIVHLGLIYTGQSSKGDLATPPKVEFPTKDGKILVSK